MIELEAGVGVGVAQVRFSQGGRDSKTAQWWECQSLCKTDSGVWQQLSGEVSPGPLHCSSDEAEAEKKELKTRRLGGSEGRQVISVDTLTPSMQTHAQACPILHGTGVQTGSLYT